MSKHVRTHDPQRRRFLTSSGALVLAAAGASATRTVMGQTRGNGAEIAIVGAGAAGTSLANRLANALDDANITVIDPRVTHIYQPGLTMVAATGWRADKVQEPASRYMPGDVRWLQESVVEYEPENNRVRTDAGTVVEYDYLLVATGVTLDFDRIEGMDPGLIGAHGIGCVYDHPDHAAATSRVIDRFVEEGGEGLFIQPPGAIKCAGAPFKISLLTEDRLRRAGTRDDSDLTFVAPTRGLFSQPDIDDFLKEQMPGPRGFSMAWEQELIGIEPEARRATLATHNGERTVDYDFIHVVPPMSPPDAVLESDLVWADGDFAGWLEVDRHTLQHRRYPNIFGVGDVIGTPIGKTAASVKDQVPIAVDNLLDVIADREPQSRYNGYTSCPLLTEMGRGILVEFDYSLDMVPSFNFISPYREHWVPWLLKDRMLQPAYQAMLRGRV